MRKINYLSDFEVGLTLTDANGVPTAPPTDSDWCVCLVDSAGVAWHGTFAGGVYSGVSVDSSGMITCYVDNPGFHRGALTIYFRNDLPDGNFVDGEDNQVSVVADELWLWNGNTDTTDATGVSVIIPLCIPQITDASINDAGELLITINYTEQ